MFILLLCIGVMYSLLDYVIPAATYRCVDF